MDVIAVPPGSVLVVSDVDVADAGTFLDNLGTQIGLAVGHPNFIILWVPTDSTAAQVWTPPGLAAVAAARSA